MKNGGPCGVGQLMLANGAAAAVLQLRDRELDAGGPD